MSIYENVSECQEITSHYLINLQNSFPIGWFEHFDRVLALKTVCETLKYPMHRQFVVSRKNDRLVFSLQYWLVLGHEEPHILKKISSSVYTAFWSAWNTFFAHGWTFSQHSRAVETTWTCMDDIKVVSAESVHVRFS